MNLLQQRRPPTWAIALGALCANLTGALHLPAAPAAAEPSGRYLVIVETSDAMRRRTEGTQKLLGDLMRSGFNGQLRPGDTIGVWTFNDKLHTGIFPLQSWLPQNREKIAAALVGFLKAQRYEHAGRLEPVLPEMAGVVKESDRITVLLITTGVARIHGTPFDAEINETYALNLASQEKARLPYVTILRAAKGVFSGYTISTPPWPVEFPQFAPPSGKAATPKPLTAPAPTLSAAEKEQQRLAALRQTLEGGKIVPSTTTSNVPRLSEPTVITNQPAIQPAAPTPPPTTATVTPSISESASPQPPPAFTNVEVAVPAPIPVTAGAVEPPPAVFQVVTETNAPPPAEPVIAPPPPKPKPVEPVVVPPSVQAPPTALPAPDPEATPVVKTLPRSVILIAGAALVLAALGLLVMLLRRPTSRPPERISLITRSLDKDKE